MASSQFYGGDPSISYGDKDPARVDDLFRTLLKVQWTFGLIPIPIPASLPKIARLGVWFLVRLLIYFVIIIALHLHVLFVKTFFDAFETGILEDISDALTMAIIYFFTTFATVYWLVRANYLLDFYEQINRRYRHHSLAGVTYVNVFSAYNSSRKITIWWVFACLAGVLCWGFQPLVLRVRILPLKCWYPFDPLGDYIYWVVYATQLYGQILVGGIFAAGSSLYVSIILMMLSQFDVLYCSLKNLNANAQLLAGHSIKDLKKLQSDLLSEDATRELDQYLLLTEYPTELSVFKHRGSISMEKALNDALLECIRLHRFILYGCGELERLFSPYCLVKSIQITFQLCLLIFVAVSGSRDMLRVINQIQYFTLTLFELFMFTYCGELLRRHSIRTGEAYWRSEWWSHTREVKRNALIFLVNSQRVIKITAGKFYEIDINRLRLVVSQAFSFVTLLRKLSAKRNESN